MPVRKDKGEEGMRSEGEVGCFKAQPLKRPADWVSCCIRSGIGVSCPFATTRRNTSWPRV